MAGNNDINILRNAFAIPDSVVIVAARTLVPPKPVTPAQQPDYNIDQTVTADQELYRSALGTPVYSNIVFQKGSYSTNTPGVNKSFDQLTYEAVLITVSQAKKIIKTEIQGRDGTVKEYIGQDDYAVTINGIITGPNGHYPVDEVIALKAMLDAPIAIDVACTYLNNLGIQSLVVDSYTLEQKEGGYSYQTFSISCISDVPQELKILST